MAEQKKTAAQLWQEAQDAQRRWQQVQQQAPGAYQSGYGAQIDALLAQLDTRPRFQYDMNGDALYKQYQQQYARQGKTAMADTLGAAAGLTGGYGSSYAVTAGNQAYQAYLAKMQDVVPSLYQAAYARYQDEGAALENKLARLQGLESTAYSLWKDQVTQHQAAEQSAMDYWQYLNDAAYKSQQDEQAQQNWQKNFDMKYPQTAAPVSSGGSSRKKKSSSLAAKVVSGVKKLPQTTKAVTPAASQRRQGRSFYQTMLT